MSQETGASTASIIHPSKKEDIVCFGDQAVWVLRYAQTVTATNVLSNFAFDAGGWRVEKHPRLIAFTSGFRQGDIVGFGEQAVIIAFNNGDGSFQAPREVIQNFAYSSGWRVERHPRLMANLRRTRTDDIVGFGDSGVYVSLNNGCGEFSPASLVINDFGYNSGWRVESHIRVLADSTGDGFPDIIGFGEKAVFISVNNGDGTFRPPKPVLQNFCQRAGSWSVQKHPRFAMDLAASTLSASAIPVIDNFAYNAGSWRVENHLRFVTDITGNGRADIVGFGNAGVWVSINDGGGTFQPPKLVISDFGCNRGWRVDKHPRFLANIRGVGRPDVVGFGNDGLFVSLNNGDGTFEPARKVLGGLGYNAGWRTEKHLRIPAAVSFQGFPLQ